MYFSTKKSHLNPQDIFFGLELYLFHYLVFSTPDITLSDDGNILVPLHRDLLPKLHVMCTFQVVMSGDPTEIGGLDLGSL